MEPLLDRAGTGLGTGDRGRGTFAYVDKSLMNGNLVVEKCIYICSFLGVASCSLKLGVARGLHLYATSR